MKLNVPSSALAGVALFSAWETMAQPEHPNILFILADDYGVMDTSYSGSAYYETPHLDQLVSESLLFTHGYAASSVCSPSRASILTGKFTARHGVTEWIGARSGEWWRGLNRHTQLLPSDYEHSLNLDFITLPEALKEEGYTTFLAGKWHLGKEGSFPEDHGFDINVGGWQSGRPKGGYFPPYENPRLPDGPPGEQLSMRLARETVHFMETHSDRPFFAFLSLYAVHVPVQTSKEHWSKYRDKAEQLGIAPTGFVMGPRLPVRQHQDEPVYAGLIEDMDTAIGYVLDHLKQLGLAENTIVIFTSDNGGVVSGDEFSTSNTPFRGGKGYQWEGGVREPFMIHVPWMKDSMGKTTTVPATGTDFYPTLLDLAGLALRPDQHNDGVSLRPVLEGKTLPERALIWHYPHYSNQGGEPTSNIRRGPWKLIHYWEDGHNELYHLEKDPYEQHDRASEEPERAQQLWKELDTFLTSVNAKRPDRDPEYDAQLEAEYLKRVATERLPLLEQRRTESLQKNWEPNPDWWGSMVTED